MIYLVSFGPRYHHFTRMAIAALRHVGRWDHDVVVLSDTTARADATWLDVSADVRRRYPWLPEPMTGFAAKGVKTEIGQYVDLRAYDYVVYLYSDVLVNSDRLNRTVAALAGQQAFAVLRDVWTVAKGRPVTGSEVLTAEERARWADVAINSGLVGFAPRRHLHVLDEWRAANLARRCSSSDQANLIAVLLRRHQGKWRYVDDSVFPREEDVALLHELRLTRYRETFIHFTRRKHVMMQEYFDQFIVHDGVTHR